MNMKLMLAVLITGSLAASVAQADPIPGGEYCGLIDVWFGDFSIALGCGRDDRADSDRARSDSAASRSAQSPHGLEPKDGTDAARPNTVAHPTRGNEGSDRPRCLGCGGLPTVREDGDPS